MIIASDRLPGLAREVTMVDGGFDPLHPGHIDYFNAAAALGLPLLCNVAPDRYVRKKHPPLLHQPERIRVIDALSAIAYTHPCETDTESVLSQVRPAFYAKGDDWRDRIPVAERRVCERHSIEIVYLDAVSFSSGAILDRFRASCERVQDA